MFYTNLYELLSGSEILQETSFGFGSGSEFFFGFVTALVDIQKQVGRISTNEIVFNNMCVLQQQRYTTIINNMTAQTAKNLFACLSNIKGNTIATLIILQAVTII